MPFVLPALSYVMSLVLAAGAAPPLATSRCDRQVIMQIDSAKVSADAGGVAIEAFGTSESAGWSKPALVISSQSGDTATIEFVACRPEVAAQVLSPIQTSTVLHFSPATKKMIVRARTNSMDFDVPGP